MTVVFQDKLLQYKRQLKAKFLTNWLKKFKTHYNMKNYQVYEKTGDVNMVIIKEKLQKIRKIVQLYTNKNIYNINKWILF